MSVCFSQPLLDVLQLRVDSVSSLDNLMHQTTTVAYHPQISLSKVVTSGVSHLHKVKAKVDPMTTLEEHRSKLVVFLI